jgi:hypothetical protein
LFRKDYSGGTPDFVQIIDLSHEAQVTLLHGGVDETGGGNPRFSRQTLQQAWDGFAASDHKAFCLVTAHSSRPMKIRHPWLSVEIWGSWLARIRHK